MCVIFIRRGYEIKRVSFFILNCIDLLLNAFIMWTDCGRFLAQMFMTTNFTFVVVVVVLCWVFLFFKTLGDQISASFE